ncbi:DUF3558 domain-containing protein [Streptomyces pyxinae]
MAFTAGVTGCTAGSGDTGGTGDAKGGGPAQAAAPPGKYRTLYEPCGSVDPVTLRDLLPAAALLSPEQQERIYRGSPAVTYDTDRRAGCGWKADGPDASHQLTLDFERVVSYDPNVSDDDRAQQVYSQKATAAGFPADPANPAAPDGPAGPGAPSGPAAPSGSAARPGPAPSAHAPAPGSAASPAGHAPSTAPSAPGTPASPSSGAPGTLPGLEPRLLADLGDAAFIDDVLSRAGSTAQHRTVSVVFRTSNVVVTVTYGEQPARITEVPDSKELQEKAQGLARKLADRFDE